MDLRRSFNNPIWSASSSLVMKSATMLRFAPWDSSHAAACMSRGVVDVNTSEPVSSYTPRAMIVASVGVKGIPFSRSISVKRVVHAPTCSTCSNSPRMSSAVNGWWS